MIHGRGEALKLYAGDGGEYYYWDGRVIVTIPGHHRNLQVSAKPLDAYLTSGLIEFALRVTVILRKARRDYGQIGNQRAYPAGPGR